MVTFTQCTVVHLNANSSMQVGLPVSMEGCGLTKAQDIAGAAWLAAKLAFHSRGAALLIVTNAMLGKVPIDLGEICCYAQLLFLCVVKFSLSLQLAVDLFVLYSQSFIICEVKTFSKEQLIWYL